jgi:carboxymethylenebutenolidase
MCFDYDAVPPPVPQGMLPPRFASQPGDVSQERLTLTSADGTQFSAYSARPATGSGAGIVILPDMRGLFAFYEELARRFASVGVAAIAIDYFGRTAGLGPRGADFEYMPHVAQTKPDQITQDVAAAIARLRQDNAEVQAVFTVGFCFGGFNSLMQAVQQRGLSGVIAFYGSPTTARFGTPVIDLVDQITCPVLGLYGSADQGIPVADVERFDKALTQAGKEHEIVIYPGAPHSFFDRTYETYQQESADAWRRMLNFISVHTPKGTI